MEGHFAPDTYTISRKGIRFALLRWTLQIIIFFAMALAAMVVACWIDLRVNGEIEFFWWMLFPIMAIITLIISFILLFKGRAGLSSYRLIITPDSVICQQHNQHADEIRLSEISLIEINQWKGMRITGSTQDKKIQVPFTLSNIDKVISVLSPFSTPVPFRERRRLLHHLLFLGPIGGGMYILFLASEDLLLAGVLALLMIAGVLVAMILLWRKRSGKNSRKPVWMVLGILFFFALFNFLKKLDGPKESHQNLKGANGQVIPHHSQIHPPLPLNPIFIPFARDGY